MALKPATKPPVRPAALVTAAFVLALVAVALYGAHGPDPVPEAVPERPTLSSTIPAGPDPVAAPGEISVLTLAGEMADLGHLARMAEPPFVAGQAASTDRRSRRPEDGDSWFANDDFVTPTQANLVRVEDGPDGDKRYVLLDATGPGAVVRLWTATPTGTLRIYIDDDPHPVVEAPFHALLAGDVAPFVVPLAHVTARGYNLYFPFPYRRRCLITVDSIVSADPFSGHEVAKLYYQVGYRTYRPEQAANVRPYASAEATRAARALWRAATALRDGPSADLAPPGPGGRQIVIAPATLDREHPQRTTITAPSGGGRLTELRLRIAEKIAERDDTVMPGTIITIAFDGVETVRAPLGQFFGGGSATHPFATLPIAATVDGTLICRFPMPFRERAVITLTRPLRPEPLHVEGVATLEPAPFGETTMLFHAMRRPSEFLPTRPFRDWHIGGLTGTGQLVGTVLTVENQPDDPWWGEGDEKIYVDGETFPSLFGTGTEDYFGYAWSTPEPFAHAYHAQPRAPTRRFSGTFAMNRFHVLDPIPFSTIPPIRPRDLALGRHDHPRRGAALLVRPPWFLRRLPPIARSLRSHRAADDSQMARSPRLASRDGDPR